MEIKLCNYSDLKRISFIEQEAGKRYSEIVDNFEEPFMPYHEFEKAHREGVNFFAAVIDCEMIGFIGYRKKGNVALIRGLFILPFHQRKGIGKYLLSHLEELANKGRVKELMLLAHQKAHWAISFYEKQGFAEVQQNKQLLLEKYWPPLPEGLQCAFNRDEIVIMNKSIIKL